MPGIEDIAVGVGGAIVNTKQALIRLDEVIELIHTAHRSLAEVAGETREGLILEAINFELDSVFNVRKVMYALSTSNGVLENYLARLHQ